MIICRAPVRIDFGGGGSDIEPYTTERGGFVVNSAIDKYIRTAACTRDDSIIKIISNDYDTIIQKESIKALTYDSSLDLIKALVKRMNPGTGVDLFVRSDIPPKSGLGASASLSTSVIGALKSLMNLELSRHEIAELAYSVEHDDLHNEGGRQDQYVSVFGGFNQIEFLGGSNVKVSKLNISSSFKKYLNENLLLIYTGKPHTSGNILQGRVERYKKEKEVAVRYIDEIKSIAMEIRDALVQSDYEKFAELITKDWELKTSLNPSVTTERMKMLDKVARNNGAMGTRFCGAGGGGCMIWACKEGTKESVKKALLEQGAVEINYKFNPQGYEVFDV